MTDVEFARAFERGEIPSAGFDHVSHLRVAWVYLREAPSFDAAVAHMRGAVVAFAAAAGASQKYHETITVAWMILLAGVRERAGADRPLADVLREYPALANATLPLRSYSRERLFGGEARQIWVEPDVAPLYCPEGEPACGFES